MSGKGVEMADTPMPPPPPYESVQHIQPCDPGLQQGFVYPSGYSNVPTSAIPGDPSYGAPVYTKQVPSYPTYPTPETSGPRHNNTVVIVTQPQSQFDMEVGPDDKRTTYFCFSLFTLCCCNIIFGVFALIYSCRADSEYGENNYAQARKHAKKALMLNIVGICVSFIMIPITYIIRSQLRHF